MVRLKVKCKNPAKIPTQRILEMNDELFILNYKVEGFEQTQSNKNQGDDKDGGDGHDTDLNEDDLLDDEELEGDASKKQPNSKTKGSGTPPLQGVMKAQFPATQLLELIKKYQTTRAKKQWRPRHPALCEPAQSNELEEKEEDTGIEQDMETEEDNDLINLPEEWIYSLLEENNQMVPKDSKKEEGLTEQTEQ